jgi:putative PEP-CTERM system TPR-repeat lipoprotein
MHPCRPSPRRAALWAAGLIATLTLCAPAVANLDAARAAITAGNLPIASVQLRAALRDHDTDPEANELMARIYLDGHQPRLALVALAKAEEGGRERGDLLPLYAKAWRLSGDYSTLEGETASLPDDLPPETRDAVMIQRALGQLASGDPKQAATVLSQLLQGPQPASAKAALAQVIAATGDLERAEELLTECLELDPTNTDAWMLRGQIAESRGDATAAEQAYSGALPDAGGRAWLAHFRRAEIRLRTGNIDSASEDIEALAMQNPDYPGLQYLRGVAALERGNAAVAADLLEGALKANPGEPRLLYATARAMLTGGRPQQALDLAQRLASVQPGNSAAVRLLARAQMGTGDAPAALATLETLIQASDTASADLLLDYAGTLLHGANRPKDAKAVLGELVARGDAPPQTQLELARALLELGQKAEALAPIQAYRRARPDDLSAATLEIRTLLAIDDAGQAIARARELLADNPESPAAHLTLSMVLLAAGDEAASAAALAQAERLSPEAIAIHLELARRDMQAGKTDEVRKRIAHLASRHPNDARLALTAAQLEHGASGDNDALVSTLRTALDRNPADALLRHDLASTLLQLGRAEDALTVLSERPRQVRSTPDLLILQIAIAEATDNPELARGAAEALLQISPESATAHHALARILAASDGGRAMEEAFLTALRLDPESPEAAGTMQAVMAATSAPADRERIIGAMRRSAENQPLVKLALAQEAMTEARYEDAASEFRDLLDARPDDRRALTGLFSALSRLGEHRPAANALAAWIARNPGDQSARYDLGVTLERAGDIPASISTYESLLRDSPEHWMAMNNLSMLLMERDPARALSLARSAHELNNESAAVLDTLGLAALANDQPEAAADALSTAYRRAQTNPWIALHFAEALVAVDRETEAIPILMEIGNRQFPGQADARALLQQLNQDR